MRSEPVIIFQGGMALCPLNTPPVCVHVGKYTALLIVRFGPLLLVDTVTLTGDLLLLLLLLSRATMSVTRT